MTDFNRLPPAADIQPGDEVAIARPGSDTPLRMPVSLVQNPDLNTVIKVFALASATDKDLQDAIDRATGSAIWRSAHTVLRSAVETRDLLAEVLGANWWDGVGGGGGITLDQALDAMGNALAATPAFTYDANTNTFTFTTPDNSISTNMLVDDVVIGRKVAQRAIATGHLVDHLITNIKIARDAVDGRTIAPDSIERGHMRDASVGDAELVDNDISEGKLSAAVREKLNKEAGGGNSRDLATFGILTAAANTPIAGYTFTGYAGENSSTGKVGDIAGAITAEIGGIYTATVRTAASLPLIEEGASYYARLGTNLAPTGPVPLWIIINDQAYAVSDAINGQYHKILEFDGFADGETYRVQVIFESGQKWIDPALVTAMAAAEIAKEADAIAKANAGLLDRNFVFGSIQVSPAGIPDRVMPEFMAITLANKLTSKTLAQIEVFIDFQPVAKLNLATNLAPFNGFYTFVAAEGRPGNQSAVGGANGSEGGVINLVLRAATRDNIAAINAAAQWLTIELKYKFEGTSLAPDVAHDEIDRIWFGINNASFPRQQTAAEVTAIANARAAATPGPVIIISNIASFDAAANRFEDGGGKEVAVPNGSIVLLTQAIYDAAVADAEFTPNPNAVFLTR